MRAVAAPAWVCAVLFFCAAIPLIGLNYDHGRAFCDQSEYHYPTILHFANGGGLNDYPSATTPGFHLLLAGVARLSGAGEIALKLFNSALTALLLALSAAYLRQRTGDSLLAVCVLLPMIFSIYIFPSGVWLLPDNLAWLTVLCLLVLALHFRHSLAWYLLTGLTLAAAVLVRQSNLWLCAVAVAAALTHQGESRALVTWSQRATRGGAALLAALPALLVTLFFVALWHGLTPPSFAVRHTALNPAALPFFLCILFCYGVLYLPLIIKPTYRRLSGSSRYRLIVCAAGIAVLALCLLLQTDWDPTGGRTSGLWNLARIPPVFYHRSVLVSLIAALGGAYLALLLLLSAANVRWVAGVAVAGFVAAQVSSHFVFERYYAGFVFILILLLIADILRKETGKPARWALAGPLLFAAGNIGVLYAGLAAY